MIKNNDAFVKITKHDGKNVPPIIEINVNTDLKYKFLCYNWHIPEKNELLTKHNSSLKFTTLSTLISEVENFVICEGVSYNTDKIITHKSQKLTTRIKTLPP